MPLYTQYKLACFMRKWAYFCLSESLKSFAQKGLKKQYFFANSKIVSLHFVRCGPRRYIFHEVLEQLNFQCMAYACCGCDQRRQKYSAMNNIACVFCLAGQSPHDGLSQYIKSLNALIIFTRMRKTSKKNPRYNISTYAFTGSTFFTS